MKATERPKWRKKEIGKKVHNASGTAAVKANIRRNVLEHVQPARVLDAYCGPDGMMFHDVWHAADAYIGIDEEWKTTDTRRRHAGDNARIIRAIDLQAFNVFDFDAFGSPWELMVVLAARRQWKRGERGAVILTDGGSMYGQFGQPSSGIANLLHLPHGSKLAPGRDAAKESAEMALQAWLRRVAVRPVAAWGVDASAKERGADGGLDMIYKAVVFDGLGS